MKILSNVISSTAGTATPAKVCMLVLGRARTDSRVMRQATTLVEAGFDVSIIDTECEQTLPLEEEIQGINVRHIIVPSWFTSTRFKPWFLVKLVLLTIRSTLLLLRTEADIYHAYVEKALPACYIAARLHRKPLVFEAPELPFDYPNITRWRRLNALATYLFAKMLPYCVGIIAVSSPIVEEIRKCYRVPEVTLIRNVPAYRTVQKSDRLRQYMGLSPENTYRSLSRTFAGRSQT